MNNALWFLLSALTLALDQASKLLVKHTMQLHEGIPLLPFFNLVYVHNTGAAFSFLHDAGGWQRWFFVVVSAGASVAVAIWLLRLPGRQPWQAAALALIVGGALGNCIDRLLYGYVIDFLDFYVGAWHWPAFNVADSAITAGVGILLVQSLFGPREAR